MAWHKKTNNLVCLNEEATRFNRLSRDTFMMNPGLQKAISEGQFTDYHCYRPMSDYSAINHHIYDLLPEA
jgi:hypothetical protein